MPYKPKVSIKQEDGNIIVSRVEVIVADGAYIEALLLALSPRPPSAPLRAPPSLSPLSPPSPLHPFTPSILPVVQNSKEGKSMHGLYRALTANMITGVTDGFEKKLKLVGVGYRANLQGKKLGLTLGLSHPVDVEVPEGLTVTVDANVNISVSGTDKAAIGQFCAQLRRLRPPEPYGGKGIRYADEQIKLKEGKKGK